LSNARASLCLVSLLTLSVACAQGVPSPGIEDLNGEGDSGATGSIAAGGSFGVAGSVGSSGSTSASQAGTFGASGSTSGSAGSSASAGNSAGGSAGFAGGASAGAAGTSASGGSAGSSSVGPGAGPLGCTYLQPGNTVGFQVQYKADDAAASVPYIYFDIEVDNGDDTAVSLSDLRLRYYFSNDLVTPTTDFYSALVKHFNGNTENLGANDLSASYTPNYVEITSTSSLQLMKGESLQYKVHMHSTPNPTNHVQMSDYSFNPGATLMPTCKVVLYQQTALAWGTPPAQ
jgi:hypothetical protein